MLQVGGCRTCFNVLSRFAVGQLLLLAELQLPLSAALVQTATGGAVQRRGGCPPRATSHAAAACSHPLAAMAPQPAAAARPPSPLPLPRRRGAGAGGGAGQGDGRAARRLLPLHLASNAVQLPPSITQPAAPAPSSSRAH